MVLRNAGKLGFGRVWIRWVMACISTVSCSALLNGQAHGFIIPERGLRQGDPLSSFLFIMCAEALVKSLNHAEATGCLQGISLDHDGPLVYHLLFADDGLLLCQASTNDSNELMCILQSYGEAS